MLIKCNGLANLGPIAGVFWLDDALESQLQLDGIMCLVDCVNIEMYLRETAICGGNSGNDGGGGGEAAQKIVYANCILLNKINLIPQLPQLSILTLTSKPSTTLENVKPSYPE
mmetsp:Transcript_48470/g.56651  ORF Transcript_48470/g.56651 Transcript_48470/m.56651 type:complete len:113 (-) Transcript_48470:204-542(-)